MTAISTAKEQERQRLTQRRLHLSVTDQRTASQQVVTRICALACYQQAASVGLYQAIGREIMLDALWKEAMLAGKQCYFPKMLPQRQLCFLPVVAETPFYSNRYGILEPDVSMAHAIDHLDVLCLPVVGFDDQGHRLGMGGGYFDHWLQAAVVRDRIGVAYAFQQVPALPVEATDQSLDWIVTEQGVIAPTHES